jgi:hypothetical protein
MLMQSNPGMTEIEREMKRAITTHWSKNCRLVPFAGPLITVLKSERARTGCSLAEAIRTVYYRELWNVETKQEEL